MVAAMTGRTLEQAADVMGMALKAEKQDGNRLTILSRTYPDPFQTIVSHAVVKRALAKIPVAFKHQDPRDKVLGYLATDSHVPILGDYLRALKRLYKIKDYDPKEVETLWARDRDMAWRFQERKRWHLSDYEKELMVDSVAKEFDIEPGDVIRVCGRIAAAKTPEELGLCMADIVEPAQTSSDVDRE